MVLGNLEDAIPADAKKAARAGFIAMAKANDFGATGLWTRINALNSPWALDDVTEIVAAVGNKLDVDHAAQGRRRRGTSTISTSCWRSSKRGTASRSRS